MAGRGAHSANGLAREEGGLWPGGQSSQAGSSQGAAEKAMIKQLTGTDEAAYRC